MLFQGKAADPDGAIDQPRHLLFGARVDSAGETLIRAVAAVFIHARFGAEQVIVAGSVYHREAETFGGFPGLNRDSGQVVGVNQVRLFGFYYRGQFFIDENIGERVPPFSLRQIISI